MHARKASSTVFYRALFLALAFHLTIVLYLIVPKVDNSGYQVLAQMQFETYDPLGGSPGGDTADTAPEAEPNMENEPVIEEPEPEPEPEVIDDPPQIVESVSEKAEEVAPPPPPPEEKPKEKPKEPPKPKPQPKPAQTAPKTPAASGATGTGPVSTPGPGTGGGPGEGQGGVGGGTGKGNPNALAAYKTKVQRKLERYKKYPPSARNSKQEGTVTVRFTINRSGKVVSSQLVKGSGFPILDDEVMALLRRVDPFPEFPKELSDNQITLTAPIRFSLRDR
jgi:protein TonB